MFRSSRSELVVLSILNLGDRTHFTSTGNAHLRSIIRQQRVTESAVPPSDVNLSNCACCSGRPSVNIQGFFNNGLADNANSHGKVPRGFEHSICNARTLDIPSNRLVRFIVLHSRVMPAPFRQRIASELDASPRTTNERSSGLPSSSSPSQLP